MGTMLNKVNQHILMEADTSAATNTEMAICYHYNLQRSAKGNEIDTGRAAYLWGKGNYMYEIEALTETLGITKCEVFESCYEDAMEKFEKKVDKKKVRQNVFCISLL